MNTQIIKPGGIMAVFQCKMCGGNLDIVEGSTICECSYCGTKQTIPTIDDDKKIAKYNRANHLRLNCDFAKAEGLYEEIVAEFPQEAEAYWGLCLCKYGIEYVDDPKTGKKVPTCHRTSVESIFDDDNYEQAKEYADAESRDIFHAEAKEIDRIQQGILDIVKNEPPYDVFICYKETDAEGQRTKDSVMAQDIYNALVRENYKVFFSRITLEGMLGQQYEPYIFAALSSAKVMLVVGTHREHFEAVWVKNEWSRFIDMMKTDNSKVLIPCYADIDAYDMPREFKNIQGQDMGKVGFIQDLVRGIGKIIPKQQTALAAAAVSAPTTSNIPALIERMFMFLASSDFDSADSYCERILDIDPKCAKAYLGKLLVEFRCRREEELGTLSVDITESQNYRNAVQYGCDLKDYGTKALYNRGCKLLEASETLKQLSGAKKCFEQTDGYEDSGEKLQTAAEKLDKATALTNNLREIYRRYDESNTNIANAEAVVRVIEHRESIKRRFPNFSGDEVPAPLSPTKLNVWFIPLGIGLIIFAICMIKYLRSADTDSFTGLFALGSLFLSFFGASIANCVARKFFSLGYLGLMLFLSAIYTGGLGSITGSIIDDPAALGDLADKIPIFIILAGAVLLLISVITIVVYCRKMGNIHAYFKALDHMEKLNKQMDEARQKEIVEAVVKHQEFSKELLGDCLDTAQKTF